MTEETVLLVRHRREPKMVGKVFRAAPFPGAESDYLFLHEESGSQKHRIYSSPGGVDAVVIFWLLQERVQWVHHWSQREHKLYAALTETVWRKGIRKEMDGRDRFFLPLSHWDHTPRQYHVPWLQTERIIDWDDINPEVIAAHHPWTPPEQETLL